MNLLLPTVRRLRFAFQRTPWASIKNYPPASSCFIVSALDPGWIDGTTPDTPAPELPDQLQGCPYRTFLSHPVRRLEPRPSSSEPTDASLWTRIKERWTARVSAHFRNLFMRRQRGSPTVPILVTWWRAVTLRLGSSKGFDGYGVASYKYR
jgi:hypothetical protein